jgi:hypothetical protein
VTAWPGTALPPPGSACDRPLADLVSRHSDPGRSVPPISAPTLLAIDPAEIAAALPQKLGAVPRPSSWVGRLFARAKPQMPAATGGSARPSLRPGQWYQFQITDDGIRLEPSRSTGTDRALPSPVRFAGKIVVDPTGQAFLTNESDAYRTPAALLAPAAQLARHAIPGIRDVRTLDHDRYADFKAQVAGDPTKDRFHQDSRYHQETPLLVDPEGDIRLIRACDHWSQLIYRPWRTPTLIAEWNRSNLGRAGSLPEHRFGARVGKNRAVNVPRLLNRVREIVAEFPDITPHIGPIPQWSPEAMRFLRSGSRPPLFWLPDPATSRLRLALAIGRSNDFFHTGLEGALTAALLRYPDRSVQIDDVFREAYRLAGGDITQALLASENILSADSHTGANRDHTPLQQKLAYIRNDSKPIFNNYGSWYHTYGMALYALIAPHSWAGMVSRIEQILSHFALPAPDPQEENANAIGTDFGYGLRDLVESGRIRRAPPPGARTDYMVLPPQVTDSRS